VAVGVATVGVAAVGVGEEGKIDGDSWGAAGDGEEVAKTDEGVEEDIGDEAEETADGEKRGVGDGGKTLSTSSAQEKYFKEIKRKKYAIHSTTDTSSPATG
jgi:hypothetical protein